MSFTDSQILTFLDKGHVSVNIDDVPHEDSFHDEMFYAAREMYKGNRRCQENGPSIAHIADTLHDNIPRLNDLLESKQLDDALTALLGEGYYRYSHSFIHKSGANDQSFHKDSPLPWSTPGGVRSHRPNWVMLFYYPQKTSESNGATQVIPGTQYWGVDREDTGNRAGEDRLDLQFNEINMGSNSDLALRDAHIEKQWPRLDTLTPPEPLTAPKGGAELIHFDLFHRGARWQVEEERYLFKFWYVRNTETTCKRRPALAEWTITDPRRSPIVRANAEWLGLSLPDAPPYESVRLPDQFQEAEYMALAYERGKQCDSSLLADFSSQIESKRRTAMYGLTLTGDLARETALQMVLSTNTGDQVDALYLLGEIAAFDDEEVRQAIASKLSHAEERVVIAAMNAKSHINRRLLANSENPYDLRQEFPLLALAQKSFDSPMTLRHMRGLSLSALRQSVNLTLLSLVTAAIVAKRELRYVKEFVALLQPCIAQEQDRYASETGNETLRRLRSAGYLSP